MLKESDRQALKEHFAEQLVGPVTLTMFTQAPLKIVVPGMQECELCAQVRELVEEVAELSEHITAEIHEFREEQELAEKLGIDKIPAIAIIGAEDHGVRFYGAPSGYEFAAFLEAMFAVSRQDSGLTDESREALAELENDVHLQVFVTPPCPHCPRATLLAMRAAVESPRVTSDGVEVIEFPHLGNKYGVQGVPHIVLNELHSFTGAVPEEVFIAHIVAAGSAD